LLLNINAGERKSPASGKLEALALPCQSRPKTGFATLRFSASRTTWSTTIRDFFVAAGVERTIATLQVHAFPTRAITGRRPTLDVTAAAHLERWRYPSAHVAELHGKFTDKHLDFHKPWLRGSSHHRLAQTICSKVRPSRCPASAFSVLAECEDFKYTTASMGTPDEEGTPGHTRLDRNPQE
jgi:hypothetical protein